MKKIAFVLSVLPMLSASAIAEDLADFISDGRNYTVRLADGHSFYRVEFRKRRSGTDWAQISYAQHKNANERTRFRVQPGMAWINFGQVTSIHEVEPRDEESTNDASDNIEEAEVSATDSQVDEAKGGLQNALNVENQSGGLVGAAVGGLVGVEAGAALGATEAGDSLTDESVESPDVVKRLDAITGVYGQILRDRKSEVIEGRTSTLDVVDAEIDLLEAQIDLAKAQNQSDEVAKLMDALVGLHKEMLEFRTQEVATGGRSNVADVAEAEIALLEAEIRLLRHAGDGR